MVEKIFIRNFQMLVIDNKYSASGITGKPELIYKGKTNDGYAFELKGDSSRFLLYAKCPSVLISWGLIELTKETNG